MALRTEDARSRRDFGTLALKDLGIRTRVIGASGPSTSCRPIRRSWLSRVITAGRGSREWWSELSTTARPGARPDGTSTTSPGSSRLRESSVSDFRAREVDFGGVVLRVGQGPAQPGVLGEVAQVAAHGLAEAGQGFFPAADLLGQPDDGAVRLELGEGGLEDFAGARPAELCHEVDGHVVRGPEAGVQRVGPPGGEARDGRRVGAGLPQHDGVALDVDAAAAGPAGQLGVLPRRDVDVRLAVELVQLLQHHAARRHVDAQGEGFGGEHGLDQPVDEQLLDDFLEGRQHAGVVRGEAAEQPVPPAPEAQHVQVVGGDVLGGLVDALGDDQLFRSRWSARARRRRTAPRRHRSRRARR